MAIFESVANEVNGAMSAKAKKNKDAQNIQSVTSPPVESSYDRLVSRICKILGVGEDYYKQHRERQNFSVSWCTGGTYGNCYDDIKHSVSPESPRDLDDLDTVLADICPNMSYILYKKMRQSVVAQDCYYDSDYYGGSTSHMRLDASWVNLHDFLVKYGLWE